MDVSFSPPPSSSLFFILLLLQVRLAFEQVSRSQVKAKIDHRRMLADLKDCKSAAFGALYVK